MTNSVHSELKSKIIRLRIERASDLCVELPGWIDRRRTGHGPLHISIDMTNPTLSTTGVGTEAYYHPMVVSDMNQHCYVRDDPHISLATSIEVDHDTRHTRFIYIQTSPKS